MLGVPHMTTVPSWPPPPPLSPTTQGQFPEAKVLGEGEASRGSRETSWDTEGFPHSSVGKKSACNAGDLGLIPGWGRSPEKEMATHCSILAWRIPWTEEPGGLQSMESQRIRHD